MALAGMWPSGQQAATPGALELPAAQTMGTAAIAHDHIRREPDSRLQQTMTRKTAEAIIREWLVRIQWVVMVGIRPKCGLIWAATTHHGIPLPASPGCQGAGDGPSPCPGRALECAGGANAEPRPVRGAGRCHERLVLEHTPAENKGSRDRGMEVPGACLFSRSQQLTIASQNFVLFFRLQRSAALGTMAASLFLPAWRRQQSFGPAMAERATLTIPLTR